MPTIAWLVQADWTVRITGLESLRALESPYKMRIELTDGSGNVAYSPTGKDPDKLIVSEF